MHRNLVHMPIKLLHNLYQNRHQKLHLNNCLLFLSAFLQHNLNLHHLPGKSIILPPMWVLEKDLAPTNSLKHAAVCRSVRKFSWGLLVLDHGVYS